MQVLTFVLAGTGFMAGPVELRRTISGRQGRTAPAFIGVFGLALVAGGLFRMDPAFGNPQGRFLPLWLGVTVAFAWMSFALADAARSTTHPSANPAQGRTA